MRRDINQLQVHREMSTHRAMLDALIRKDPKKLEETAKIKQEFLRRNGSSNGEEQHLYARRCIGLENYGRLLRSLLAFFLTGIVLQSWLPVINDWLERLQVE